MGTIELTDCCAFRLVESLFSGNQQVSRLVIYQVDAVYLTLALYSTGHFSAS